MGFWRRLRNTFHPAQVDRTIREELEFHRAMLASQPGRRLGSSLYWQEETRSMNLVTWLSTIVQDVRYGVRDLGHSPGFTATATLSLALGILATTAMYSVIYGVVLNPFPYKDVDNLVSIAVRNPELRGWRTSYSVDEYVALAERSHVFSGVALSTLSDVAWRENGEPIRLRGNHISHNGFDVMGVPAMLGRATTASDADPEATAVLGYQFWVKQFGARPSVIGQTMVLNDRPRVVIGVMPPRFMFRGADVYLPIHYRSGALPEGVSNGMVTARRHPGVTNAQARTDLDPVIADLAAKSPGNFPKQWRVERITFAESFPSGIRDTLWILFAAVGLLLLIACANVSNLLLARASSRQKEMAMRAALGASRLRIFRQLLTESLLLGLAGSLLGVLGSWVGLKAILAVMPPEVLPSESEVVLNLPVLAFSFGLCLAATVLFGLAPALHSSGGGLNRPLQAAGRGRGMNWLRGGLVVGELTLSVILLACAGLFLATLVRLHNAPLAVQIENRLSFLFPSAKEPRARTAYVGQFLDKVKAMPGVLAVGLNAGIHPLGSMDFPVTVPSLPKADPRPVNIHQVNVDYLKATGIARRRGEWFTDVDIASRRQVGVVNEAFLRRYPITLGQTVKLWRLKQPPFALADDSFEIVGVVADALHELHNGEASAELYIPYSVLGLADAFVVHTQGDPAAFVRPLRLAAAELDPNQVLSDAVPLASLMDRYVYSRGRFNVWLMGSFGLVGLTLAALGVYGLFTQIVAVQGREIGIRMALGATRGNIVGMVLRRGVLLLGCGLSLGAAVTILLLRQFGVRLGVSDPLDPVALTLSCAMLFATGLVACFIPAWRAGKLDPARLVQ